MPCWLLFYRRIGRIWLLIEALALQANSLEDGQLVSLDLKELEHGQGLAGHMTCSGDVLSLSAAQSLKSSFDVSVPDFPSHYLASSLCWPCFPFLSCNDL